MSKSGSGPVPKGPKGPSANIPPPPGGPLKLLIPPDPVISDAQQDAIRAPHVQKVRQILQHLRLEQYFEPLLQNGVPEFLGVFRRVGMEMWWRHLEPRRQNNSNFLVVVNLAQIRRFCLFGIPKLGFSTNFIFNKISLELQPESQPVESESGAPIFWKFSWFSKLLSNRRKSPFLEPKINKYHLPP